jgi:hypothetical protein
MKHFFAGTQGELDLDDLVYGYSYIVRPYTYFVIKVQIKPCDSQAEADNETLSIPPT